MNYKEALFFIARCLTISKETENRQIVLEQITSEAVDWDRVVQISTSHYVFPALYINLERANFLSHIPSELVSYMKHITDLNRERNAQIISQARHVNHLLTKQGIQPVFLKGTGSLLQGLYEDIGERMVGDIDFLVSKEQFDEAVSVFETGGYSYVSQSKYQSPSKKHYPRIHKEGMIAALEVHHEMTIGKYKREFNYNAVVDTLIKKDNYSFLSLPNQLVLTLIAKQINDNGQYYKTMSLRNGYDTFLLAQRTHSLEAIRPYKNLFHPLNNFLSLTQYVFNTGSVFFEENEKNTQYLKFSKKLLNDPSFFKKHYKNTSRKLFLGIRLKIILKAFVKKEYRYWLYKKITDPIWYREKKKQLGIK